MRGARHVAPSISDMRFCISAIRSIIPDICFMRGDLHVGDGPVRPLLQEREMCEDWASVGTGQAGRSGG